MRRRLCRILLSLSACLLMSVSNGCRSTAASAAHAAPSAASSDLIRTDGIYECRGAEVPVSTGGWPLLNFGPTTARWAYFLRFYQDGDGETRFIEAREPITTAEAVRRIDHVGVGSADGKTYLGDDHRVHIVFARPFPRYSDGTVGDGQLILRWNTGPGPVEASVFRFVKWP